MERVAGAMAMHALRAVGVLAISAAIATSVWAAPAVPLGDYETARTPDDEFVRLSLMAGGKAKIIAENNFQIPGDPAKRRGRTTSYAKWSRKGANVTITYAKISDRLKFDAATPLARIGLSGTAPALYAVQKSDANSRLRNLTLWRLPHTYRQAVPAGAEEAPAPLPK